MTLFPTNSLGTSVPISLSLLNCLLYPDGITLQAGRIYSTPPSPPSASTWLTRHSICRKVTFSADRGRDVVWTEEVLAEANKYIKFPAGSGDKGSGR